ncbi:HlyD family secretion protein [Planctomicrobium sp. SH661]|uniref:HlyD family secretion protein n=1 Tax=Planctomicrobium sp. SH661 TaxID=3448124 RepID=UPI003F5CA1B1
MSNRAELCPELPASPSRIALFAGLALITGIVASLWIDRPTGTVCPGYLTARTTVIHAAGPCSVSQLSTPEGSPVRIGDPLVVLQNAELQTRIVEKEREILSLTAQLAKVEAEAELELKWRLRTLEAEICEIQLRSAGYMKEKYDFDLQRTMLSEALTERQLVQNQKPDTSLLNVAMEQELPPPGRLATVMQLEAVENAAEVSAAQVEICDQRESSLTELKQALPTQIRTMMGADVAQGRLEHARAELEQLQSQNQQLTIVSPSIGQVGIYRVQPGDHLKGGEPIVELLDASKRSLTVHVPSQSIHQFAVGSKVSLVFSGGVNRSGEVTRVAPQAERSSDAADTTVQVQVDPRGALWPDVPVGALVKVRPAK